MSRKKEIPQRLADFWFGSLKIEIPVYNGRRIINMCHYREIFLWDMETTGQDKISFCVSLRDFKALGMIFKKAGTRFHIAKKSGMPFVIQDMCRKKSSVFGFFSFFLVLFICSAFVWDIEILGQEIHTEKELADYLGTINVSKGMRVKNVDGSEIERSLRKKYADIGWVSAQLDGSVLTIRLVEVHKEIEIKDYSTPRHIIAPYDGKVVSIVTRHGTPRVKEGEMVSKGAVLVSGVVEIIGDDESVISRYALMADADVVLERSTNYKDSFPLSHTKRTTTGKQKNVYGIGIKQRYFYLTMPEFKQPSGRYYSFSREKDLSPSFFLPIKLVKKEYLEYEQKKAVYTENEAERIAGERLESFLKNFKKKGVLIIENNVTISIDDGVCTSRGNLLIHEPVTSYKKVNEKEWRMKESDGNKGDNT